MAAEPAGPDVVSSVVAPDATYVSLNTENPELAKIMSWAGTSHGPQAFLDNLGTMFTRWDNQAFNVTTMFASDENVAVFGDFRYKSHSLGKIVNSPFSGPPARCRCRRRCRAPRLRRPCPGPPADRDNPRSSSARVRRFS
jgi:hypothetical protein